VPDFCEEGASDPVVGLAGAPLSLAPLQRPSVSCEGTVLPLSPTLGLVAAAAEEAEEEEETAAAAALKIPSPIRPRSSEEEEEVNQSEGQ